MWAARLSNMLGYVLSFCSRWQDAMVRMWARVETKAWGKNRQRGRGGGERERERSKNSIFFFFYNRYSPVLVQAMRWKFHLHRDRRGGIPVHLPAWLHGWQLPPETRNLPHKRVMEPLLNISILTKGIFQHLTTWSPLVYHNKKQWSTEAANRNTLTVWLWCPLWAVSR